MKVTQKEVGVGRNRGWEGGCELGHQLQEGGVGETPPRTPIDKGNVMILFYVYGAVHMIFMLKSKKNH